MSVVWECLSLLCRPKVRNGIASLSSTAAGLLQSFITSFAGSVSHKSLPQARYRLAPMLSILPAFSSPDLKVFLLLKKSFKSSAGGQMSCLLSSELSAAAIALAHISAQPRPARLCDLLRSATAPLHKSHRLAYSRINVASVVILSVGMCLSRKDPYLPLEPQCVRLLPRPTGLPPMAFVASFRLCSRRRENRPQTP